jgi:hypothetical protein
MTGEIAGVEYKYTTAVMLSLPLFVAVGGVMLFLLTGSLLLVTLVGMAAGLLLITILFIVVITGSHDTTVDRLGRWFEARTLKHNGVWSREGLIDESVHGVENVLGDGSAEMHDGRFVGLYRLQGVNTAKLDSAELNTMSASLSRAFDEHVHPEEESDVEVGLYSATFGNSATGAAESFENAAGAEHNTGSENAAVRELLYSTAHWLLGENDATWRDAGWRHYIVVECRDDEVAATNDAADSLTANSWTVRDLFWTALGLSSVPEENGETRRTVKRQLLTNRFEDAIKPAVAQAGLDGERVGPEEMGTVLSRFYAARETTADGGPALEPGGMDPTDTTFMRTDARYSRALWIGDWPPDAQSMFLRKVYTMNAVDADVRLRFKPEDSETTISDIEHVAGSLSAEGEERGETSPLAQSDIEEDSEYWIRMRRILRRSPVQPWRMTGYVVVHADTADAIEEIEDSIAEIGEFSTAALKALESSSDRLKQAFESHPAETRLLYATDPKAHLDVWQSASPVSRDVWAESTEGKTIGQRLQFEREVVANPRRRLVLGGMIGATFPPCSGRIDEAEGIVWGRNEQNGSLTRASPFLRGEAPHMITLGKSRSGKTFATEQAAIRWYEEDEENTLILCDTQNGFHGATELLNGIEILIGGGKGINPFDIQPVSDEIQDAIGDQIDPLGLKISGVTSFIVSLAESQGGDPGDFYPIVQQSVQKVYADAEITQDLTTHSKESPTFGDFIDTVNELFDVEADENSRWNRPEVVAERQDMATELLTRLSTLQEDGIYHYLMSEDDMGLNAPEVDMAYLNLHQIRKQDDLDKSAMLMLMLDQVSEKIKRAPGKTMFVIDEAHALLQSEKTVTWLNKAVREWARYDASIHFVSQSPSEFIAGTEIEDDDGNKKRPIIEQSSIVRLFNMPKTPVTALQSIGGGDTDNAALNETQIATVRGGLVPGNMGLGYSQCLMAFEDRENWWPIRVESSPFEEHVLNYEPSEHGAFGTYVSPYVAGDATTTAADATTTSTEATADGGGERTTDADDEQLDTMDAYTSQYGEQEESQ